MTAQIDLTRFCLADSSKYGKPATFGGFTYATDCRICVRVPSTDPDDSELADWVKSSPDMFAKSVANTDMAWPEQAEQPKPCFECDGTGSVEEVDCDECNGTGLHECWSCGHEGECPECDGSGVEFEAGVCPECEGRKVIYPHRRIAGLMIGEKYDAMIRKLPNPRVVGTTIGCKALHVIFDGGELLVMAIPNLGE